MATEIPWRVSETYGTLAANYDYGPFGEVIRQTGPMAKVNPIRFSTKYQDDESDLLYYGYRYYKASTGTWLSRDPSEEDEGGPNLYGFVANNAVDLYDILGLRWMVMRDGDATAVAVPQAGDTINDLANLVGLNANQYPMWLSVNPGTYLPSSPNQPLTGCGSFSVPNTVVAYWAGFGAGIGKTFVSWNPSVRHLRPLGFKVDTFNHKSGDSYALQRIILADEQAKQLHGLYFWGHGYEPYPSWGLVSQSGDPLFIYRTMYYEGTDTVAFQKSPMFYGLALGLVFACDSNSGKDALMSGNANQIWNGYTDTLNPFKPGLKFNVDNYIQRGQQATH